MRINNKAIIFVGVGLSASLIVGGILSSGSDTNSSTETPPVKTSVPVKGSSIESIILNTTPSPGVEYEIEDTEPSQTEPNDTRVTDESLAKQWFDLKSTSKLNLEALTRFKKDFKTYLGYGLTPQIVEVFPAIIVTRLDSGFSVITVDTLLGSVNIISAILPTSETRPRVLTFIQNVTDSGVQVMNEDNLGFIPSERGILYKKDSTLVLLAGNAPAPFKEENPLYLSGYEIKGMDINPLNLNFVLRAFEGESKQGGNLIVLDSNDESTVFSYNEKANEGILQDSLYLVKEFGDSSKMYEIVRNQDELELKLNTESGRW
jgi:hypothetical protein